MAHRLSRKASFPAPQDDVVDARPTKRFFVRMLVRDIELVPAIIDLVDNSVDGAKRLAAGKSRAQKTEKGAAKPKIGEARRRSNCRPTESTSSPDGRVRPSTTTAAESSWTRASATHSDSGGSRTWTRWKERSDSSASA